MTARDALGRPTAFTIVLSPDADGLGWFIDPTANANSAFGQTLANSSFLASPGSAAYGHYDLLAALA